MTGADGLVPDVLVVGGGIAGWSAAWFAMRAGRSVTLVDAARDCTSRLPVASINPIRGREGRIVPRGIDGMRATFELVDAVSSAAGADAGSIVVARGVLRPLVDAPAEQREPAWWAAHLPPSLAWSWHARVPPDAGLRADGPAVELHDAGAIDANALLDALRSACAVVRIDGEVVDIVRGTSTSIATLVDGHRIEARRAVWCGGAWGAARLEARLERSDGSVASHVGAGDAATYRPGSVAILDRVATTRAVAYGVYATPLDRRGLRMVFGPSREPACATYEACRLSTGRIDASRLDALHARADRLFERVGAPVDAWRGVRLERLSSRASTALAGVETLTAFGSRAFLMAPLLAREWAATL